jgi:thiol-disulfide isomerase/thioredoxin
VRRHLLLLALLATAAACGTARPAAPLSAQSPAVTGARVTPAAGILRQVAGEPVVYLFTAPGCASCAAEAQALASAAHGRPAVQLVGVDLANDQPGDFAAYVDAIGLGDSPFLWTVDEDGSLARRFGVVNLSSTVFVDGAGNVRFLNPGPVDAATLSTQLSQLS